MQITRVSLANWRNFLDVDVELKRRAFLVGPNASGKSNFLDAIRFLRDVADPQGGFQRAVSMRAGVGQIRSLYARQYPTIVIDVRVQLEDREWRYALELTQDKQRRAIIRREEVTCDGNTLLERPDKDDLRDDSRLTQTHLEQVNTNKEFRPLQEFLAKVRYLHVVPQLVREPDRSVGRARDPYGGDFLEQLASTSVKTLKSRLRRINQALRIAVPELEKLELERDHRGVPHLRGLYKHWRPNAGWQKEDQLSDGTLRLLGLLWALLDGQAPLLLEEPELSLHPGVVRHIPSMMARLGSKRPRQVIVSTHSADLLQDPSIALEEVLMLIPTKEATRIMPASMDGQAKTLLDGGATMAEAVLPRTAPRNAAQLALFGA